MAIAMTYNTISLFLGRGEKPFIPSVNRKSQENLTYTLPRNDDFRYSEYSAKLFMMNSSLSFNNEKLVIKASFCFRI